jgi:hypothetical protein
MTKECLMSIYPQAGKAPRVLDRGVRPARPRMTEPVIPTNRGYAASG